jgi:hypothetical protein
MSVWCVELLYAQAPSAADLRSLMLTSLPGHLNLSGVTWAHAQVEMLRSQLEASRAAVAARDAQLVEASGKV